MYNTVEYSYENEKRHLHDDDALERYKEAKLQHPGAIVVLNDLDCGHWDVDIYETPEEKEKFYKKTVSKTMNHWLQRFRNIYK